MADEKYFAASGVFGLDRLLFFLGYAENLIEELLLALRKDFEQELNDQLWKVLSHPNSKIRDVTLRESVQGQLISQGTMMIVKRWCTEIPPRSPRKLTFQLEENNTPASEINSKILREILECRNNGVEEVEINNAVRSRFCELCIRPVLENEGNGLRTLSLNWMRPFSASEAEALSLGLSSPYCKLKSLIMQYNELTSAEDLHILNGVKAALHLESLEWSNDCNDKSAFMSALVLLLKRPDCQLTSLTLTHNDWEPEQLLALAGALIDKNCKLQELECNSSPCDGDDRRPIARALRHPWCSLRFLAISFIGADVARELEKSLTDPNCKLESLRILQQLDWDDSPSITAKAIANALKLPNTLQRLSLYYQDPDVFFAFAESLSSRHNRVKVLILLPFHTDDGPGKAARPFLRALRVSNVHKWNGDGSSFDRAFNTKFFQVVQSLLYIKHIPRLGQSAWLRILPMQDFIFRIAETLGWPLNDLGLPMELDDEVDLGTDEPLSDDD